MRPLNFAILKYLTTVDEACPEDIIEALKGTYGTFRALNKKDILSALMTAEVNGLVQESRFELDENGELRIYYRAHEEGAATINRYIVRARGPRFSAAGTDAPASARMFPVPKTSPPLPAQKRDRIRGPFCIVEGTGLTLATGGTGPCGRRRRLPRLPCAGCRPPRCDGRRRRTARPRSARPWCPWTAG